MDGINTLVGGTWPEWTIAVTRHDESPSIPAPVDLEALDDGGLVRAALDGRPEAFDVLVVRHRRAVYQVCYRFMGNHEDAMDLAQDAFLRAYRALRTFKGDAAVGTWLYRIAVNVCLNKVGGKALKTEPIDERDAPASREPDVMSELMREERAGRVRAAIARLPRKQRATLVLRVYQELPHQEIAKLLGSSVGAVKANFFHALNNLRRLLQDEPV